MKILIVEDETPIRKLIKRYLKNPDYEVFEAGNGREGFKTYQAENPDIIISDIDMPEMDGLELLERIREKDNDTIVIITTSMDAAEYTLKALRKRANDYIGKPFSKNEMVNIISKYVSILENRTHEREIIGMITKRELELTIGNRLDLVGKVSNRLLQETEGALSSKERLGIYLGLVEILTNSIEHGNLEITYDEKTDSQNEGFDVYNQLISKRLEDPNLKDRKVSIDFKRDKNSLEWTISDEGPGFDYNNLI